MKHFYLSTLFIMGSFATVIGQNRTPFTVKFSPEYEYPKKHEALGFYGTDETGYAALSFQEDKEIVIQNLDKSFVVKKTTPIDLHDYPKSMQYDGVYQVGGKTYWFYSNYDKKEEVQHLEAREVDLKNSKILSKSTELVATKSKLVGSMEYHSYGIVAIGEVTNKFKFYYDVAHTKILIMYMLEKEFKSDKKNKDRIGLVMVDSSMNKLWSKEIVMPYFESEMSILDYQPDSKGNAYILVKKYETTSKKEVTKDGAVNSSYEIIRLDKDGNMKNIKMSLDNILIKSLNIYETADHTPVCVGYYSGVVKKNAGIDGVFCARIDEDGTISKFKKGTYEFPTDLLMQNESNRTARKAEKKEENGDDVQLSSITPRKVIFNPDGSLIIVGEVFYVTSYTSTSNGHTYTTYIDHYCDVYVTKIAADGSLSWVKKIAKHQVRNGSVGAFAMGDDFYLFYMDNGNNLFLKADEQPHTFNGKSAMLTCVGIDKHGAVTKSKLLDMRDEDEDVYPVAFEKINETLIISRAIKNKRTSKIMTLKKS
ncbi:MAG: hypothetical protein ABI723_11350 [Bacteroidia bacterium]